MAVGIPPSIEVTIPGDGSPMKTEVLNAPDNSCLKLVKNLEEALGKVTKRTAKPEMYKEPSVKEKIKIGQ